MRSFLAACAFVAISAGASAQSIATVLPGAGTVGDQVTITGTGFGTKKPTVTLKTTAPPTKKFNLKVLSHNDTTIITQVPSSAKGGDFDVSVKIPGIPDPVVAAAAFTVAAPLILTVNPPTIAPGGLITVTGDFFGPKSGGKLKLFQVEKRTAKLVSWTDTEIVFLAPMNLVNGGVNINIERKPIGTGEALNGFLIAGSTKQLNTQRLRYRALKNKLFTSKLIFNSAGGSVQNISGITTGGNPNLTLQMIFDLPDSNPHVYDGSELPLPAVLTYTESSSAGVSVTWSASGGGGFKIALQVITPEKLAGTFSGTLTSPGKQDRNIKEGRFIVKRP